MESQIEKLITVARGETGYLEKASNTCLEDQKANAGDRNYTKYGAWYGMNGQPWCAMFVSWCVERAGIGQNIIPRHASCTAGMVWFKQAGRWVTEEPRAGDIVYFTQNGATPVHVGIVYNTDGSQIHTVEGNTSSAAGLEANGGCVAEKRYPYSSTKILGYGRPEYGEDDVSYEDFKEMMDRYMAEQGTKPPSAWSEEARRWAEAMRYIQGDGQGNRKYKKPITREETVQLLFNVLGEM